MSDWDYKVWVGSTSNDFEVGQIIKAKLYKLNQTIHECKYLGCTSYEEYKDGYRPGLIVKFDGKEYWVLKSDTEKI